jgi:hypothetical protein
VEEIELPTNPGGASLVHSDPGQGIGDEAGGSA